MSGDRHSCGCNAKKPCEKAARLLAEGRMSQLKQHLFFTLQRAEKLASGLSPKQAHQKRVEAGLEFTRAQVADLRRRAAGT